MNLPTKLKVAGIDYTTELVSGLSSRYQLYGQVHYGTSTIEVDTELSHDKKAQVYIHELIHAMMFEAGYDEQEEEFVRRFTTVLHQVLRDNDFSFIRETKEAE